MKNQYDSTMTMIAADVPPTRQRAESTPDRMVFAILPDVDADRLLTQLAAYGFRATRIASSGGYLRTSNSTLLIGLPATRLATCLSVLRSLCSPIQSGAYPSPEQTELYASGYASAPTGAGVVFVATVTRFERIAAVAG